MVMAKVRDHRLVHAEDLVILGVLGRVVDGVKQWPDLVVRVSSIIQIVVCEMQDSEQGLVLFVPKNKTIV